MRPTGSRTLPLLVLIGVALPWTDTVCTWGRGGVLGDSQLLLEEQVTIVARRTFAQLCLLRQLHSSLDQQMCDALVLIHFKMSFFRI